MHMMLDRLSNILLCYIFTNIRTFHTVLAKAPRRIQQAQDALNYYRGVNQGTQEDFLAQVNQEMEQVKQEQLTTTTVPFSMKDFSESIQSISSPDIHLPLHWSFIN